jgi:hypothetical protein
MKVLGNKTFFIEVLGGLGKLKLTVIFGEKKISSV